MTILYTVGDGLYVNLTNLCPCDCTFCIRQNGPGAYGSDPLWLEHEPTYEEVIAAFDAFDLSAFKELVFCGYGEPMERPDLLLRVCSFVRGTSNIPIRINTNGLSDLINGHPTAPMLDGLVDTVSISLNAPTAEEYLEVTRPCFGAPAFDAMLKFATECKKYVPEVLFTVVDVLAPADIEAAQRLADSLGIALRVRHKI